MKCPECGKELGSERGMRQHHTKVHGEPLPNRVCKACKVDFYDPKARRTYCENCEPNVGENNGNWTDAKEPAICEQCGDSFRYYPSNKEGQYCPDCVAGADGLLPHNPMNHVEPLLAQCEHCRTELQVTESRLNDRTRGVFCDQSCHGEWMSENIVGGDHHAWRGGRVTYGAGWSGVRRRALRRDGCRCQLCGKTDDDIGRNPDVHHIEPVRTFENPVDAHRLENVVCLCRSCHGSVENGSAEPPTPSAEGQF